MSKEEEYLEMKSKIEAYLEEFKKICDILGYDFSEELEDIIFDVDSAFDGESE